MDTFEKEEEIDLHALLEDMKQTDEEIAKTQGEFVTLLKDLTSEDATVMSSLNEFINMIGG